MVVVLQTAEVLIVGFLGALSGDSDQDDKLKVHLKVNGKPVEFNIYTGEDATRHHFEVYL